MINNLRLISGLVLFTFVLGHFSNHALGIISLKVMNAAIDYTIQPWRTQIGTILITSALGVHIVLACWSIYNRKTLRMRSWEAVQLVLGFLIPVFMAAHVLSTRGGYEAYGLEEGYAFHLHTHWAASPMRGIVNAAGLLLVWIHGCMGWHYWLRLKPWYPRIRTLAFSLVLLVPTLALAGFISAGMRVKILAGDPLWVDRLFKNDAVKWDVVNEFIGYNERVVQGAVLSLILIVLMVHFLRSFIYSRPGSEQLNYRNFEIDKLNQVNIKPKITVLELLRRANIPHASVCGGRGRCSTCRIRIDKGMADLPAPDLQEIKVLNRIAAPLNVRLACQLVPTKSLTITALLRSDADAGQGFSRSRNHEGAEQEIAVLFADIRAFTKISEGKLPYDVAFLLNRYFSVMGQAIESSGGHLDKFIGDGVMALFGIDKKFETGCLEAIRAAHMMAEKLDELNKNLANDLDEPLKIGIGIHAGTAIVGNMGYHDATNLTAIGDIVNTSSRLEAMTKDFNVQLVLSEETSIKSGIDLSKFPKHNVTVRGRTETLVVHAVKSALDIDL